MSTAQPRRSSKVQSLPFRLVVGGVAVAWLMPLSVQGDPAPGTTETPTQSVSSASSPLLSIYPVPPERLEAAMNVLRKQYSDRGDVRITHDRQTSRIFLYAPPAEQARMARWIRSWPQPAPSGVVEQAQYVEQGDDQAQPIQLAQAAEPAPGPPSAPPAPPAAPPADGSPESELTVTQAGESARNVELLRRLGFDVQVEVMPGQDVVILRGRDVDVDAVARIIQEIERIAARAQPQIEIISIANISGVRLAALFEQVSPALIEGRQGRVVVTPIGTPNAILLIGWGEVFESAKTLIAKLDRPSDPNLEIRTFPLQHASAANAATVVREFFTGREGIGPDPQVAIDPRTNSLIIYAPPRDMAQVALLVEQLDVDQAAAVKQVRVFQLDYALASDLVATLQAAIDAASGNQATPSAALELLTIRGDETDAIKSGLLDGVQFVANPQTNSLVVTAPADAMPLVEALIDRLDQPVATSQIKVFRIEHGDANSLVLMLRALLPAEGSGTGPQLPGAEGETALAPLRFAVEQRTNSIIATGAAGDLRIVHALLLRLDEDETQRRQTTVYALKNAPALDVARAVNQFLSSERQVQQISPGEESALEQLEREVVVVPEPVSNSLIVSATRRFYADIIELVEQLDAQPPQVVIQVLIAQVELNDADEFGVEMGLQDSVLFDRSLLGDLATTTVTETVSTAAGVVTSTNQVIQAATNEPGFDFRNGELPNSGSNRALANSGAVGGQGLTTFSLGRTNDDLGFGGLVLSASSESVSLLVRALQESRRLSILSRPQITTLDNQQAFIQVGQRVPRVVSASLTAFGQTNSVELENVGLILLVTPRISPNGMVVMEVDAERSEVGPESEGIPISTSNDGTVVRSPRIDVTSAQTTVTAASGETIILGGLITEREQAIHRRVPVLADVPLLGDLFRYDSMQNRRLELLIILTPHVVMTAEDMERIRQIEESRMHWCAADVQRIHSMTPLYGQEGAPVADEDIPLVYPDMNPRGVLPPQTSSPTDE